MSVYYITVMDENNVMLLVSPSAFPCLVLCYHAGFVFELGIESLLHLHIEAIHVDQRDHSLLPEIHENSQSLQLTYETRLQSYT